MRILAALACTFAAPFVMTGADPNSRLYNFSALASVSPAATLPLTLGFQTSAQDPVPLGQIVLFRAVGPSLAPFGLAGFAADPMLTAFDSGAKAFAANDDYGAEILIADPLVGAFPLVTGSKDAALMTSLRPGAYTVQVTAHGGSGTVLAEVYENVAVELNNYPLSAVPQMVNVSALSYVPAKGTTFVGFVLGGAISRTFLIRTAGPTLGAAPFGLAQSMPDPQLTLYAGSGITQSNAGWAGNSGISAAAASVGAFSFAQGSKDAAMLVTLAPGAYTFSVSSVSGTAGLVLAEVYLLPQ